MFTDEERRMPSDSQTDLGLRDRAIAKLKKKRDLQAHLLVYVMVNTLLVVVWLITDRGGFFWPIFPLAGWGIGVVMNVWEVYRGDEFDEAAIRREMERQQSR